ncbi:MAG: hypothetical protein QOG98_338, partial [Pseudonocardiales bacterium]|nr:hypothetical protein [Pseudonocardiales bacterium]
MRDETDPGDDEHSGGGRGECREAV